MRATVTLEIAQLLSGILEIAERDHTHFAAKRQSGSATTLGHFARGCALSQPVPQPHWTPERYGDRRGSLEARARISTFVRRWFGAKGFIEVQPATLQVSPGNETHLHGFKTALIPPDGSVHDAYLHTSPEFAMKKLLAGGERLIFALSPVFRNRERTALHAPEFVMLEWYRAYAALENLIEDCAAIIALAAHVAGTKRFSYRGREANPFSPPERLTVRDAFRRYAGIDIYGSLPIQGPADREMLAREAKECGVRVAPDDTWSDIFSRLLSERVEPSLGLERPTILYAYPASEAALAQVCRDDPRIAERFELYCCGVELANAFHELRDPDEQRRRFSTAMQEKWRIFSTSYPIDEDFLVALDRMPDASGAALGFDRLVMLATGAEHVEFCPVDSSFRSK